MSSRRFYEAALAPLGYRVLMEIPTEHTGGRVVLGYGVPPKPDFWMTEGTPETAAGSTSRSAPPPVPRSTHSIGQPWPPEGGTTGRPDHDRTTTRATTERSCSTPDGHNVEVVFHGNA